MALKLSSGLRNALAGNNAYPTALHYATTISFGDGDGTGGRDTINDSGSGLGSFVVGQYITVAGSTSNNISGVKVLSVAAGTIEVAAGTLSTEAAGDPVIIGAGTNGGGLAEILRNGVLEIYSGSQPTNADAAESGTKLLRITIGSGAFSGGTATNGLNFELGETTGKIEKASGETWSGLGLADGVAGWGRFYANAYTTGASTTAVRLDGSVGTSGATFIIGNTTIEADATTTVDSAYLTVPAS